MLYCHARQFAIIDEAFPYLSKRLLTDDAPRLRAALRYMVHIDTAVLSCQSVTIFS